MPELIDFNYAPYPKINAWVKEMRKFDYISKANEVFEQNREAVKSLRVKPEPKL